MNKCARVLITDDEKHVHTLLKDLFQDECEIESAYDGEDALAKLQDNQVGGTPFSLMICDINMPKMDGLTLIKTMREKDINTQIILVSGNTMDNSEEFCNTYNVKAFLSKPSASFTKLLELVHEHCKETVPA